MTMSPLFRATAALALFLCAGCGAQDTALSTVPQESTATDSAPAATDSATTKPGTPGGKEDPTGTKPSTPVDPGKPGTSAPDCNTPAPAVKCVDSKSEKGEVCTTCYDASGKVIKQGCSATGGGEPAPTKCYEETTSNGELCKVCVDPTTGKEIDRACAGTTAPAITHCEALQAGSVVCKICYDDHGAPVTKDCAP